MDDHDSNSEKKTTGAEEDLNFFERILSIFINVGDEERQKKRALKTIGKNLSKDRYKFYKPRGKEIQPPLGRLLYEIYKSISVVRKLVQTSDTGGVLKLVVIDSVMDERQMQLREALDEKTIREAVKGSDLKQVSDKAKETMIDLVGSFDANRVKQTNTLYSNVRTFVEFCHFDYYFTLKKFDSAISEDSFSYKPKFEPIDAEYVVDDVKDFLELAVALPAEADWDAVFDVLSAYRNVEVVDRDQWRKIWKTLRNVIDSHVLEDIARHGSDNPGWAPGGSQSFYRIVEPYLTEIKNNVEETLQKISSERRNNKIENLVKSVFGTTVIARTKNYTEKANVQFQRIEGGGYIYVHAMNYLKAYLLDYFKKDVREIVQDLLIVRGKWVTNVQAQQISDAYHGVLSVSEQIIKIDDGLGDEGEVGQKMRRAMGRVVDRDRSSQKFIREILDQQNKQILELINEAAQDLIIIGKNLKLLIEDADRKEHQVITNWKELDGEIEESLKGRMGSIYKQLYYFVQLLQVYAAKGK